MQIRAATGHDLTGDFGPVGGMRDRIVAGASPDFVILSRKLIDDLAAAGHVGGQHVTDIGDVATGVALRAGDPDQPCATAEEFGPCCWPRTGCSFPIRLPRRRASTFTGCWPTLASPTTVAGRLQDLSGRHPGDEGDGRKPACPSRRLHAGDRDPAHQGRAPDRASAPGPRPCDDLYRRRGKPRCQPGSGCTGDRAHGRPRRDRSAIGFAATAGSQVAGPAVSRSGFRERQAR
jgi:hypothetical protein